MIYDPFVKSLTQKVLLLVIVSLAALSSHAQVFTGDGTWHTAENWDGGAVPADGATAVINGNVIIDQDIGSANSINPGRIIVGQDTEGSIHVTGGTLSGAHGGNSGIFVGDGTSGVGEVIIDEGAALRSQGGNMVVRVGSLEGASGRVVVAGELLNYKFFEIFNGTLEMRPTGINNKFNSTDLSIIGENGTLAYVIDGQNIGALERANTSGLNVQIDDGANLHITLTGNFEVGDSWTLMKYTSLVGFFQQDEEFTNQQGYTFQINYGSGFEDEMSLTLTSTAERPQINDFSATPSAITAGGNTTLNWNVGGFDSLSISPEIGDVTAATTDGSGSVEVSPSETTTYTLTLEKSGVLVTSSLIVLVDEAPVIASLQADPALISPGDSTTLRWVVEGATSVSIEPDPGAVDPKAEGTVQPDSTTTYTLTAENEFGTTTAEVEVVVDAILVARTNVYDASADGNSDGFFKDSVGINNFDLKSNELNTAITSLRTTFTAANRMVSFTADTGGDALGFPGGDSAYELWVRPGELDTGHQVIFETGGGPDGFAILINDSTVRFINSVSVSRSIDFTVPLSNIDVSDFIQIVAVLDESAGEVTLYVNGSAGGSVSGSSNGEVASPVGRSTLFSWSSFAAGIADALGGAAGEVPEGTTQFRGEMALFNVFGRTLTQQEVQTQFDRYFIPDPELINSFTATPQRGVSGSEIVLEWSVKDFDTLEILPNVGDVSGMTAGGNGSVEVTLEQSTFYTLRATSAEGGSAARIYVLADVDADVVVLESSGSDWTSGSAWSNGEAPMSGSDYLVLDILAPRLVTPDSFDPVFAGDSLELRGIGTSLVLAPSSGSTVTIDQLILNGGSLIHGMDFDEIVLDGAVEIRSSSSVEIDGDFKSLTFAGSLTGEGNLVLDMAGAAQDQASVNANGSNENFSGDWIVNGGTLVTSTANALGSGKLSLANAYFEPADIWDGSNTAVTMSGALSRIILAANTQFKALNLVSTDGVPVSIPAGSYDSVSWENFLLDNPTLAANTWIDLFDSTLEVLGVAAAPVPGPLFEGSGDWNDRGLWSNGFPSDGSNAVINGEVSISGDIASSAGANPGNIFVGSAGSGKLIVSGGTLSGAHGGQGVFIGVGSEGVGEVIVEEGSAFRSQGGGMNIRIGDSEGGSGSLTVSGELLNYKYFEIINGTLTMMPTGLNRSFNSNDQSVIGANGILEFVIVGDQVGTLQKANDTGLHLNIDPEATLKVSVSGALTEGQSWVLADYTALNGEFAQGTSFTNEQGHTFEVDYGSGEASQIVLTLVTINPDVVGPAEISISATDGNITISFSGTLESADSVNGPWTPVANATSPMSIQTDSNQKFYRAR